LTGPVRASPREVPGSGGRKPRILVLSSLFPQPARPGAGLFVRERMFRVAGQLPLVVVSPQPWFPGQALIRRFRPQFRPPAPRYELQQGIPVHRPRFLSFPGWFKALDGLAMAVGSYPVIRRIRRQGGVGVVDGHFGYPDGYAATLLGSWLGVPATVTLRGTEVGTARTRLCRRLLQRGLGRASRVFTVSGSLATLARELGVPASRVRVVANGVDPRRFRPLDRAEARARLGLDPEAPVLITVGGLVERKGIHRVMEQLPALQRQFPEITYLVVGEAGPEGDWGARLKRQARELGLDARVRFLGAWSPEALPMPLSAADVFVLASRNEGWANVLLEAMACGLPVVASDVGGNPEVVSHPGLGKVVPFGDGDALRRALEEALSAPWDRAAIRAHAAANSWDDRVATLVGEFRRLDAGKREPAREAAP